MVEGCFSTDQPFGARMNMNKNKKKNREYSGDVVLTKSVVKCIDLFLLKKTYQSRTAKPRAKSCWTTEERWQFTDLYWTETGRPSESVRQ